MPKSHKRWVSYELMLKRVNKRPYMIEEVWRRTVSNTPVKEYVSCMSMPENGLDCQSRRSETCVVNNGTFSTEVLRVSIGYRSTRSKLFPLFGFRSKTWPNNDADGRVQGRGCAHFSQQRDHGRAELSFRLCISTKKTLKWGEV